MSRSTRDCTSCNTCKALKNPDDLLKQEDRLPLSAINQENEAGMRLYASARQVLSYLNQERDEISVADTADMLAIFAQTRFNGDGDPDERSGNIEHEIVEVLDLVARLQERLLGGSGIVGVRGLIGKQGLERLYTDQSAREHFNDFVIFYKDKWFRSKIKSIFVGVYRKTFL